MANFLLVYSGGSMPEESEMQAVMKAWEEWYASLGEAVVDPGNPMNFANTISSDGSVTDSANGVMGAGTGYTILAASSREEAVEMAKKCPVLDGGSDISIFETFPAM